MVSAFPRAVLVAEQLEVVLIDVALFQILEAEICAEETSGAVLQRDALIAADSAPRRLTVVSSDHRLQRAAHRRKATAIDSDKWFAQLMRDRQERHASQPAPNLKPEGPFSAGEVEYWLKQFGEKEENLGE